MEIERFFDLGAEIETQISGLYAKIATITHDDNISKTLIKISREELNHAAALKMGKNYLKEAPDIFLGVNFEEEDLNTGIKECREFQEQLQNNFGLLPSLKWLLRLEKRFEMVHIGAAVAISDAHLKQLFQALAKGDQNHIKTLETMISDL